MKRPLSLQTRVAIASGLAAGIVIAAIGIAFAVFLRVNGSEQLERTLDSVTLGVAASAPSPLFIETSTATTEPSVVSPGFNAATVSAWLPPMFAVVMFWCPATAAPHWPSASPKTH